MGSITSVPTSGVDCPFGLSTLDVDAIWDEPVPAGPFQAAIRLGDSASLRGNGRTILSTSYAASTCAIVRVDGERAHVEGLRFSNARYGIATPDAYDTSPRKGHTFFDIHGSANDRAFRVSGNGTRLERFSFGNILGCTADTPAESMAFGVEVLGAAPVIKNGSIYNLAPINLPGGLVAEAVGLSFSNGCAGGFAEDIQIANPALLAGASTIGVWAGGGSLGLVLRNITVVNMGVAFWLGAGGASGGVLENCTTINCPIGFGSVDLRSWKRRNCTEIFTAADGTITSSNTYND
jgi:hypothetical protein